MTINERAKHRTISLDFAIDKLVPDRFKPGCYVCTQQRGDGFSLYSCLRSAGQLRFLTGALHLQLSHETAYNRCMAYSKLSEQVQQLSNPQRSDAFVKQFRTAVREGDFEAAELPGRFDLPKAFKKRGSDETYSRGVKDMVFEVTPAFEQWFEGINAELSTSGRRSAAPKPTLENIESGAVDFKALAEETRRKMQASFEKGQALGNSRKAPAKKAAPKRTAKKK